MITTNPSIYNFSLIEAYNSLLPLIFYILGITIYSIFIFRFYKFLAKRDIFELNLTQYNYVKHALLNKLATIFLYVLEYLFLFPLFIFFWFLILTILLVLLSKSEVSIILLISMGIVGATRIVSYYNEDLSRDLAKMVPFALLGIFILDISYFSLSNSLQKIASIPFVWDKVIYYLVLMILIEFLLRIVILISSIFSDE